jgi:glycosyltransferase involved in cell wall biosynthesis
MPALLNVTGLNCAFDYYPSSFSTGGRALMGLQAANEGFLRAFLRHGHLTSHVAQVRTRQEAESFTALVAEVCGSDREVAHVRPDDQQALEQVGALLHPFPGFGPLAWNRNFRSPAAYSLLGITHTTATQAVMDSIGNLAISPIQSWDAVVCTSSAVRQSYEAVLEFWDDHLRRRLGARQIPRPQLPIIPLGVDTSRITPATSDSRQRWRSQLNIPAEAFVVLWVGRFNHAAKAHPIPAYLALERLAQRLDQPVVYLQSGWFANEAIQQAFQQAAHRWAPSVTHLFVDGREPQTRQSIWHAADVFLSLSDNLQETFGLTPIEAMAAQLPVVVSDWDGYRDTVRDGVDGFRIPTTMPGPGHGRDLSQAFCAQTLSYDHYCAVTCQSVAVDLEATVQALERLALHPSLRRELGSAGRQRALDTYEWAVVINQYCQLLAELAERRSKAILHDPSLAQPPSPPAPLRGDPYAIFAGYPTASLDGSTRLRLAAEWQGMAGNDELQAQLEALHRDRLHHFAAPWRLPIERTRQLLALVQDQPGITLDQAVQQMGITSTGDDLARLQATVGWLLKLSLLMPSLRAQ